ncbi:MAG: CHAT domain-containing protein [Gemmatimonadota bacterium]
MLRAIEAEANFQYERAVGFYESAMRRDPHNLDYQIKYATAVASELGPLEADRRLMRILTGPSKACRQLTLRRDWARLLAAWDTSSARACLAYYALGSGEAPASHAARFEHELERSGLPAYYELRAQRLVQQAKNAEAVDLLKRGMQKAVHPHDRIALALALAAQMRVLANEAEAVRIERATLIATTRAAPAAAYWWAMRRIAGGISADSVDLISRRAAAVARRYGAWGQCAEVLTRGGWLHVDRGDPRRAVRVLNEAMQCAERSPTPFFRMQAGLKLGRAQLKAGQNDAAIATLTKVIPLARSIGSAHDLAEAYHNLAHAHEGKGDWPRARSTAISYVAASEKLHRSPLRIISLRDAGIISWNSGERAAARNYFERMIRLVAAEQHEFHWAAEYYERIGDLPRARSFYLRSLTEQGDSARKYAGLTRVHLALANVDSAEVTARLHDQSPQTPEEIPLLPEVQAARHRYAEAISTARQWAALQKARENLTGAANALIQTARLALESERFQESERAATEAAQLSARAHQLQARIRALTLVAAAQSARRDPAASTNNFRRLIAEADRVGEPMLRAEAYSALAQSHARRREYGAALAAFDSANAARRNVVDRFEDDFDRVRFGASFANAFEETLAEVALHGGAARVHDWLQRRKTRGDLSRRYMKLTDLAKTLQPDEAALDFLITGSFVGGLAVTRDTAFVFELKLTRDQLRRLVDRMRQPVTAHYGRVDFARARFDYDVARQLYRLLLQPLESAIGSKQRWFISPDDALQLVPFDALVTSGTNGAAHFVIDNHEVIYVLSTAAIGRVPVPRLAPLAVIASVAPGSESEARSIMARGPAKLITPPTESAVAAALAGSRVIHFAVHGEANVQQPLASHLRVAAGAGNDGYLHTSEISRLRTKADLVVLTACETITSRMYAGDGALSVARSFLTAGARSVIATQWSVGPSAAQFSDKLYANMRVGRDAAHAARAAKLELRRAAGSNPLIWAPFILLVGG